MKRVPELDSGVGHAEMASAYPPKADKVEVRTLP